MPNKRDIRMSEYGISKYKYRELLYFCKQYNEKKKKISELKWLDAINYDSIGSSGKISTPTENKGIELAGLTRDIEMIESAAKEADEGIHKYILSNVTEDIPYEYMPVPCGRRQFYLARRKFFYILSKKK